MDKNELFFSIPTIDEETNFWMVRAKRGFFFDEFVEKEFIAIGWNSIAKSMLRVKMKKEQTEKLKESIKNDYGESRPGTALNKCVRFCYEVKNGDIAVIVDNDRMAFAYIGDYYEEESPELTVDLEKEIHLKIENANVNSDKFKCPYVKRRRITIIKIMGTNDTISPYLQSAIARNWHSLSDLNDYAENVLSGCFDAFIFKDRLNLTFRVKRKNDINVLDLSTFVLLAAKFLSGDQPEKVNVKTTLHSPGDILLQIWNFIKEDTLPLLLCYVAIFGGKVGNYEFNSLLGTVKSIINWKFDKKKQDLELDKLVAEIDLAKQQARSIELDNIEKQRKLHLDSVDNYSAHLLTAAENLEIEPSEATIIDVSNIIKNHQEKL